MGWSSWDRLLAATILLGLGQPAYLAYLVWVMSTNFGLLSLAELRTPARREKGRHTVPADGTKGGKGKNGRRDGSRQLLAVSLRTRGPGKGRPREGGCR